MNQQQRIAVLIPCLDEAVAIAKVVQDFRKFLPDASIYVYDNGSSDQTAKIAAEAGAITRVEPARGKGRVVRRMFSEVDADIYVLVDGDGTYDAFNAPALVDRLVQDNLDMVIGVRVATADAYRAGHKFGNRLLTGLFSLAFGHGFTDLLSGYRVLSRRFVKSFPALANGFEVETEISVHALQLGAPCAELQTTYFARPVGSKSKLSTYRDGWRILGTIVILFKEVKPFVFFGVTAAIFASLGLAFGVPVIFEYAKTGLVNRFPTAILASALELLAAISFAVALILDSVGRGRLEMKRLQYLGLSARTRDGGA